MEIQVKEFNELSLEELYQLLKLRVDVFVVEQNCPYPELDNLDQDALHILIKAEGEVIAYARVLPQIHPAEPIRIGRVIAKNRRQGLGTKLMQVAIEVVRDLLKGESVYLEAQTYAESFYQSLGFQRIGQVYLEDGIPHVSMVKHKIQS